MEAESEQSSQHMRGQSITPAPAGIPEQREARTDLNQWNFLVKKTEKRLSMRRASETDAEEFETKVHRELWN